MILDHIHKPIRVRIQGDVDISDRVIANMRGLFLRFANAFGDTYWRKTLDLPDGVRVHMINQDDLRDITILSEAEADLCSIYMETGLISVLGATPTDPNSYRRGLGYLSDNTIHLHDPLKGKLFTSVLEEEALSQLWTPPYEHPYPSLAFGCREDDLTDSIVVRDDFGDEITIVSEEKDLCAENPEALLHRKRVFRAAPPGVATGKGMLLMQAKYGNPSADFSANDVSQAPVLESLSVDGIYWVWGGNLGPNASVLAPSSVLLTTSTYQYFVLTFYEDRCHVMPLTVSECGREILDTIMDEDTREERLAKEAKALTTVVPRAEDAFSIGLESDSAWRDAHEQWSGTFGFGLHADETGENLVCVLKKLSSGNNETAMLRGTVAHDDDTNEISIRFTLGAPSTLHIPALVGIGQGLNIWSYDTHECIPAFEGMSNYQAGNGDTDGVAPIFAFYNKDNALEVFSYLVSYNASESKYVTDIDEEGLKGACQLPGSACYVGESSEKGRALKIEDGLNQVRHGIMSTTWAGKDDFSNSGSSVYQASTIRCWDTGFRFHQRKRSGLTPGFEEPCPGTDASDGALQPCIAVFNITYESITRTDQGWQDVLDLVGFQKMFSIGFVIPHGECDGAYIATRKRWVSTTPANNRFIRKEGTVNSVSGQCYDLPGGCTDPFFCDCEEGTYLGRADIGDIPGRQDVWPVWSFVRDDSDDFDWGWEYAYFIGRHGERLLYEYEGGIPELPTDLEKGQDLSNIVQFGDQFDEGSGWINYVYSSLNCQDVVSAYTSCIHDDYVLLADPHDVVWKESAGLDGFDPSHPLGFVGAS